MKMKSVEDRVFSPIQPDDRWLPELLREELRPAFLAVVENGVAAIKEAHRAYRQDDNSGRYSDSGLVERWDEIERVAIGKIQSSLETRMGYLNQLLAQAQGDAPARPPKNEDSIGVLQARRRLLDLDPVNRAVRIEELIRRGGAPATLIFQAAVDDPFAEVLNEADAARIAALWFATMFPQRAGRVGALLEAIEAFRSAAKFLTEQALKLRFTPGAMEMETEEASA